MCDIDDPEILIASHIVRWSEEKATRGLSENVICLCVLHDALFEQDKILTQ
jgi:putative restriction endonuclease